MEIVITLSEAEAKALAWVAADPQEWADNAVRERARLAMEAIFQQQLPGIMASGDVSVLSGGVEAVVLAANLTRTEPGAAPSLDPTSIQEPTEAG